MQKNKWLNIVLTTLIMGVIGLEAQVFQDDFESYAVGSRAGWDESNGSLIVNEDTMELLGSPNQSMELAEASIKLLKDVQETAIGGVTTLSADFVEMSGESVSSGLQVGFGRNNEMNTDNAVARVELEDGQIRANSISGMSKVTQSGIVEYQKGEAYRLYMIVNDTESALTDYLESEDLAAGSYEVWLYSEAAGYKHVLEATMAPREPGYAGFRTWSSYDAELYIDNVWIDSGVSLSKGGEALCKLEVQARGIATGEPFELNYTVNADLPEGATYEVTSDSEVSFENGGIGAAEPSGQIEAAATVENRKAINLRIDIQDSFGEVICSDWTRVIVFDYEAESDMEHPSVINTEGQLKAMKNLVNNYPDSVARSGWDAFRNAHRASLSYSPDPQEVVLVVPSGGNASEAAFRDDAAAARAHALQWVVTEDPAHRDKALEILNIWGQTFRDITSTGSAQQVYLEAAWALPVWISAADIMRYYNDGAANWDPDDMAAFNYFADRLYEEASRALDRGNNWGVTASLAVMAYGAWIDDVAIFETGLNNQLTKLDKLSELDGEIVEVCRDTWHPQYSVITWGDSAELARNLGRNDLYEATFDGQSIPRLGIVLEYFANLMLGKTEPPCSTNWEYDYHGEYALFDNYEVPYNHYINRLDADYLPSFKEMVENYWRQDVGSDDHFFLWSRLTHGTNVLDENGNNIPKGKGSLGEFPADAHRWVNTDDWFGWVNDINYPWLYSPGIGYFYTTESSGEGGGWIFVPR